MAVELMMGYRNDSFVIASKMEENAVQEAASGLENCKAVADVAVSKFKKVISLLGRNRTGHARFRRAPNSTPPIDQRQELSYQVPEANSKVYYALPIQQVPPPVLNQNHYPTLVPKNGVIERKDSAASTINFSYSSAGNSFVSSLTGDTDSKQPSSSSAFQFTNVSQASSAGKPPLSTSSLKRKCSSENLDSAGKCASSGRCHCSKKRKMRLKTSGEGSSNQLEDV
ncbi:WRKY TRANSCRIPTION FACTOR 21-RELATED [Salix purpurea]|uniref:WRKY TRANSCRIPTION FACTOR 21-RELATED n=1 Tax=Salix purpurea TaxID=77065 RepID=A0A9Q0V359_SALPP|nr:WRKY TRANSCRIPTION FACTOR 21-RELATED [Salix purpurea]